MKFKRIISAVAVLAMSAALVPSLSGCGSRTIPTIDYKELIKNMPDVDNYVYPEEVEIKIPVYNRAQANLPDVTNNYWTRYVQKEFGDKHNIKVSFISISRSSAVTQLNQRLAGKVSNQPDIVYDYDYPVAVNFANQGVFRELTDDFIKHFAPDYYEYTKDLDEYSYLNGKKIFLLARRPQAYNFVTLMRKDWMDKARAAGKISFEEPRNEDETIQMYQAWRDLKLGGATTIPSNASLGGSNYGAYAYRPYPLSDEDNALYSDITVCALPWEPVKQSLKNENFYFHEGLISSDWYLDKDGSKAQERFLAGQAGTFGCYLTKSPDYIAMLKENVPDAEVTIGGCYPDPRFTDPETGKNFPTPSRAYYPYGLISGINNFCQHPEAVMMYYEWMYDNIFTMQNGIEGKNFNFEKVSGVGSLAQYSADIPVIDEKYSGEERFNYNNNKDMWCLVVEGKELRDEEHPDEWINVLGQEKTYAPKGYEWLIEKAYDNYEKSKDYQYTDYAFTSSINTLTKYSGVLLTKWQDVHTKLVTCDPKDFDALYDQAVKEYLQLGYQEVLDEKKAKYQAEKAEREANEKAAEKEEGNTSEEDKDVAKEEDKEEASGDEKAAN